MCVTSNKLPIVLELRLVEISLVWNPSTFTPDS